MQQPHIIRLRKPWTCRVVAKVRDGILMPVDESPHTVDVPGDWSAVADPSFRGEVQYARYFNRPTGIGPGTRVKLCFEMVDGRADVRLNGQWLGEVCWPDVPGRFDITQWLANRNQLDVTISLLAEPEPTPRPPQRGRDDAGGLLGEVNLEIR